MGVVAAAAIAMGCSPSADTAAPQTADSAGGDAGAPDAGADGLVNLIGEIREKLRNAPGRTGILAEKRLYSVFDEELIIRDYFQDRRDGFYLDVGCAWADKGSNTYYLEEQLGWTGIGVDALDRYRGGWEEKRPRSKFRNYLVTDHAGTSDSFYTSEARPGLSSTSRENAAGRNLGVAAAQIDEVQVQSITLDALLEREGVERIDLISMDIEGHEPEALAGFDIDRFRPELLVIEGKSPEVTAYLERHGYVLIERYLAFDLVNRYFERRPQVE
jgi:FkbM family methyltransferase